MRKLQTMSLLSAFYAVIVVCLAVCNVAPARAQNYGGQWTSEAVRPFANVCGNGGPDPSLLPVSPAVMPIFGNAQPFSTYTVTPFGKGSITTGSGRAFGRNYTTTPFGNGFITTGSGNAFGEQYTSIPFGNGWTSTGTGSAFGSNYITTPFGAGETITGTGKAFGDNYIVTPFGPGATITGTGNAFGYHGTITPFGNGFTVGP